jgi:MFS family permease
MDLLTRPAEPAVRPLWTRDFAAYFLARTVSRLGDEMVPVALAVGMLRLGYGAAGVGYTMAAFAAPEALLMLFGGVLADRFTPLRMMIGADALRVVLYLGFLAVFLTDHPALWLILTLAALSGAANAIFQPGICSLVPQVAVDVHRANAVLRVAEAIGYLAGPAVGAVLVLALGTGGVFGVDAATFAVSAVLLLSLRSGRCPPAERTQTVWRELRDGWYEFRSRRWLWTVIVAWMVNGALAWGPARPLVATLVVRAHGASGFGLVQSLLGVGTLLGGLLAAWVRPRFPLAAGAAVMFGFALSPLSVALHAPLALIAGCSAVAGTVWTFWSVQWTTTLQTQVPPALLNRVYAYDATGSMIMSPVGRGLGGPLGTLLGPVPALLAGVAVGTASFVGLLCLRSVRGLRRIDPR